MPTVLSRNISAPTGAASMSSTTIRFPAESTTVTQHRGCAHSSAWSRGQAWAIYGYTVAYRYTGNPAYFKRAADTFEFMRTHLNMPSDKIPYWDMDAPGIPDEPRDASAAAVIASGLYEMSTYPVAEGNGSLYRGMPTV